jgi:hypothetical protein
MTPKRTKAGGARGAAGVVGQRPGNGLIKHGDKQPGEGHDAQKGIFLGIAHQVQDAHRQDDTVQALGQRRQGKEKEIDFKIVQAAEKPA